MRAGIILSALLAVSLAPTPVVAAPFTLQECRAAAGEDHPTLAAARAEAAAAKARSAIALSPFLPQVVGDASYFASRGSIGVTAGRGGVGGGSPVSSTSRVFGPAEFELWGLGLTLRQQIWDFGRTLNAHQAAVAFEEAAAAEAILATELVDIGAEAAYRTAVAAGELVESFAEAERRASAHLDLARARAEVGLRPQYDVRRAEVEVANAAYALVQAENARDIARAELANACGLAALPPEAELVAPAPRGFESPSELQASLDAAVEKRPEIVAARARVEAAAQALDAAWAEWYPELAALGTLGLRGIDPGDLGPGWTATVQLTVPLITGGADLGRVRAARADLEAAQARLEAQRRSARLEGESGGLSLHQARARLEAAQRREDAAAEGLRLAEGRYETGLGDVLELADAQAELAGARADRVRSALDVSVAAAQLERLLGRWSGIP
ncbi:TolC family protein [Vulgatibacter sp.]|uniref:TolC family protein n=1 Tax=Vulgatibacter sp. TaxID=1971226 RepID=UPI0035673FD9